jgi:hypothetical protein
MLGLRGPHRATRNELGRLKAFGINPYSGIDGVRKNLALGATSVRANCGLDSVSRSAFILPGLSIAGAAQTLIRSNAQIWGQRVSSFQEDPLASVNSAMRSVSGRLANVRVASSLNMARAPAGEGAG